MQEPIFIGAGGMEVTCPACSKNITLCECFTEEGRKMIDSVAEIKPVGDKVLVARDRSGELTDGGIVIPESAQSKYESGTVLAVGPGVINGKGVCLPLKVQVGDHVQFILFAGHDIDVCGETLMLMPEKEILGVLSE